MPLPRQCYGIDFYGHQNGEILVALDLCTREVLLWFLPSRKQDLVAKALLSGLIFQKGVPLLFRNDEASEFVKGVVNAMNGYLGIDTYQIHKKFKILALAPLGAPWAQTGG